MISINQIVLNKKGEKGIISKVITKSTGYVEVSYENGSSKKEMAFNLTDENGVSLKKAPKKADPKPVSPLQECINKLMWINTCVYGDRSSMSYMVSTEIYADIELKAKEIGNDFILSICRTVEKYMRCSEKQAYFVAKFALDNNINL